MLLVLVRALTLTPQFARASVDTNPSLLRLSFLDLATPSTRYPFNSTINTMPSPYTNISITPGQSIAEQQIAPSHLFGVPTAEWNEFGAAYDRIVVVPYRRAKVLIAAAFIVQLVILMGMLTLTDAEPTARLFLGAPCAFGVVAAAAGGYMFTIYPRVSQQLEELCQDYNKRWQAAHHVAVVYKHNDVFHDLRDHVIQLQRQQDIETAVPVNQSSEWNPLLQLRSLWNGGSGHERTHHQ